MHTYSSSEHLNEANQHSTSWTKLTIRIIYPINQVAYTMESFSITNDPLFFLKLPFKYTEYTII